MAQIYAFGDSITYGAWDVQNSGWATRMRQWLDEKQEQDPSFYALFYNLGIPGETTDRLVKRFLPETQARLRNGEEYTFIIAFGANDACYTPSKDEFKVPVERYIHNLDTVITQAKEMAKDIFVLNITPVVDTATAAPEGKDKSRLNKYIEPYNQALSDLTQRHSVKLIDVYSAFMQHDLPTLFDEDGLHLNEKGHEIIFKLVQNNLMSL